MSLTHLQRKYLSLLALRKQRTAKINARLAGVRRAIRKHGGSVPRLSATGTSQKRYCILCGCDSITTRPVRFTYRSRVRKRGPYADSHSKVTRVTKMLCTKCHPRKKRY